MDNRYRNHRVAVVDPDGTARSVPDFNVGDVVRYKTNDFRNGAQAVVHSIRPDGGVNLSCGKTVTGWDATPPVELVRRAEWENSAIGNAIDAIDPSGTARALFESQRARAQAAFAAMPMVPKPPECTCKERHDFALHEPDCARRPCVAAADAETQKVIADNVSLRAQLDAERQRANRLADECGSLKTTSRLADQEVNKLYTQKADLESQLRTKDRTIAALRDQIRKLGARPL